MPRRKLAAVCGLAALVPFISAAAPPSHRLDTLTLKNAPVRQALEMVVTDGGAQLSLDKDVTGVVTLDSHRRPIEDTVIAVCRANSRPLVFTRDEGQTVVVYTVKPDPAVLPPRVVAPTVPVAQTGPTPTDPARVSRRVSGILMTGLDYVPNVPPGGTPPATPPPYAILETGAPGASNADVRVVHVGVGVPSGVAGVGDLHVTRVDADGVTLETSKGTPIRVLLSAGVPEN